MHTHSRVYGAAPRKALAVHCTLAHSGAWRGIAAALEDDLSILAYDLPSHGKSDVWDGTGDLHDLATEMARKLLTEPMDLIGHSFGATVALRLAIESPELVRSVTMFEPVYFAGVMKDHPEMQAKYDAQMSAFNSALEASDAMLAAQLFNRDWGDGTKWEAIPEQTRQYMADRIHFVAGSTPFLGLDSAGLLNEGMFAHATMPALLLEGDQSPQMSGLINTSLEWRLPNVRRVVMQDVGHMAPITHANAVASQIKEFIASV